MTWPAYLELYSDSFGAQGKSIEDWRVMKTTLFKQTGPVQVELSNISVKLSGSIAMLKFKQHYRRPGHEDLGVKTLYLHRLGQNWRIFNEEWRSLE